MGRWLGRGDVAAGRLGGRRCRAVASPRQQQGGGSGARGAAAGGSAGSAEGKWRNGGWEMGRGERKS